MKALYWAPLISLLFACANERKVTRRAIRHERQLQRVANELFAAYTSQPSKETFLAVTDSGITRQQFRFLKGKMHMPWIHLVYDSAKRFIDTDSVVLFTKTGIPIFGYQHNILVDLKSSPRAHFYGFGSFDVNRRISDRIFYIKAPMPVF